MASSKGSGLKSVDDELPADSDAIVPSGLVAEESKPSAVFESEVEFSELEVPCESPDVSVGPLLLPEGTRLGPLSPSELFSAGAMRLECEALQLRLEVVRSESGLRVALDAEAHSSMCEEEEFVLDVLGSASSDVPSVLIAVPS